MNDGLSQQLQTRLPTVLGGLAILLVVINGALALVNRSTQTSVAARAQYINQTVQLDRILQAMARAAATAALNNKDVQLGEVLNANGIRYEATAPAPNASPTPAVAAPGPASATAVARPASPQPAKAGR